MIIWKMGLAWYVLMFSTVNLIPSGTNALFISHATNSSTIKAGKWTDHSLLTFTNDYGGDSNEIIAYIKNTGSENMARASQFNVYYSETGNPVDPHGNTAELVYSQGVVPIMTANGESIKLSFKPQKPGFYMFVAFQNHEPIQNGKELIINGKPSAVSGKINVNKK